MSYDLSEEENCYNLFEACKSYPISVVINSAGFGKVGYFPEIPLDSEIAMINTNIISLHILTKLFANTMKKGRILNVASMAGFQPAPTLATYSATKAYVLNFSVGVNYELKRNHRKVHISTLCPGPVATEFDLVAGANFSLHSITAKLCAKEAVDGLFKNKDIIIPSFQMKLIHCVTKLLPYRIILPIEYKLQTRKLTK
jgi:short-subunit dehydrogenase